MILKSIFKAGSDKEAAWSLYRAAVAQARQPEFYTDGGLPDSLDGRFEMIALHCYVLLRRLRVLGSRGDSVGQELVEVLVTDMDRSLREMGVGDLSVGKRVRRMLEGFYGRLSAYDAALDEDSDALEAAIRRNVFGTTAPSSEQVAELTAYLRREAGKGAGDFNLPEAEALLSGKASFGPPPRRNSAVTEAAKED